MLQWQVFQAEITAIYASSMYSNKPAITLYERAISELPPNPDFNRALADPTLTALLKNASNVINYSIIP